MILVSHRTPTAAPACAAKVSAGATTFELDVQLGHDDAVVVSHFLPVLGWLEHDNWRFRLRARGSDPAVHDLLAVIPSHCDVLLDPKESEPVRKRALTEALIAAIPDPGRFVVSTRDLVDLDRFRSVGFRTWRTIRSRTELVAAQADGRFDHPGVSIRHTLLSAQLMAQLDGIDVVAWTVNDVARAKELVSLGVAGITTDESAVLRSLSSV